MPGLLLDLVGRLKMMLPIASPLSWLLLICSTDNAGQLAMLSEVKALLAQSSVVSLLHELQSRYLSLVLPHIPRVVKRLPRTLRLEISLGSMGSEVSWL